VPPVDTDVDGECRAAAHAAAELLAALGHEVEEVAPDWGADGLLDDFRVIWQPAPTLFPVNDTSVLSPLNRAFLEGALEAPSSAYVAALTRLQLRARKLVAFWAEHDLLLTPTLALPPVPVGWDTEPDDPWEQFDRAIRFTPFTAAFNVTGQPAVSLPLHWTAERLPVGVQLVGPPLGDALLLRIASQLEAARPWADKRPPHS
jgi:amidase